MAPPPDFHYRFVSTGVSWATDGAQSYLSFSANGKSLAGTKEGSGPVCIWNSDNGATVTVAAKYGRLVMFSPSEPSELIASASSSDYMYSLWQENPSSGTLTECGGITSNLLITYSKKGMISCIASDQVYIIDSRPSTLFYAPQRSDLLSDASLLVLTETSTSTSYDVVVGLSSGKVRYLRDFSSDHKENWSTLNGCGNSKPTKATWSPNGAFVAVGDSSGVIRIWKGCTTDNPIILRWTVDSPVTSLAFTADSQYILATIGGRPHIWKYQTSQYMQDIGLPTSGDVLAFSGTSMRLAVATANSITIYEMKDTKQNVRPSNTPGPAPSEGTRSTQPPPNLSELDISNTVSKTRKDPYVGLFFDICLGERMFPGLRGAKQLVAIKVLKTGFNTRSSRQERKNFEREFNSIIKDWYNIEHENIVLLLGITMQFGRFPALVIPWMINGLLNEYIKNNGDVERLPLLVGIAKGVQYLHSKEIIHRDIRATSILVDADDTPRLADPGLLRVLESSPLVKSGGGSRNERWMAPELLKDTPSSHTFSSDVYAYTMTCLEVYSGDVPYPNIREALVPSKVLQGEKPGRPDDVSDALWDLWGDGWDSDESKRPDMTTMLARLEECRE